MNTNRDAPIIGIGRLVNTLVSAIVVYTTGDKKFLKILLPKVNKHESVFRFR